MEWNVGRNNRKTRPFGGLGEGERRILKWGKRMCTGFMWLRVEVGGAVVYMGVNILVPQKAVCKGLHN